MTSNNQQEPRCFECRQPLDKHLDSCETYKSFKKWYGAILKRSEKTNNIPRPEGMCTGCDQPKDGRHRFSCVVKGYSQLALPASRNPDTGIFSVSLPGQGSVLDGEE